MVEKRRQVRRNVDKKNCQLCVAFLIAIGMTAAPHVWEQITSIASRIITATSATQTGIKPPRFRGGM